MNVDKQQVARQFSRAAARYDQYAVVQREMAEHLLNKITDDASGNLIDLGCGTGQALDQLQQRTQLALTGIDIAAQMIDQARRRVPAARLQQGDIEHTSFASRTFDFVFSSAALQWCVPSQAIAEMKRIIKPNGQLLIATFGDGTLNEWATAWASVDPQWPRVHRFLTADSLGQQLQSAGFQAIEIKSHLRQVSFESVRDMINSVRRIGATYAANNRSRLSRDAYQQFVDALADLAAGQLQLSYHCLYATARSQSDRPDKKHP